MEMTRTLLLTLLSCLHLLIWMMISANNLNTWFGNINAENLVKNVTEFKKNYYAENNDSPVQYKLFIFPNERLQIIAVRSTAQFNSTCQSNLASRNVVDWNFVTHRESNVSY